MREQRVQRGAAAGSISETPSIGQIEARWFDRCFVGRDGALDALVDAFERARSGPVVHWVHGVAGQGKSTLVRRFVSDLARDTSLTTRAVWLALGGVSSSPSSIDALLEVSLRDAGAPSLEALGREHDPDVLVLDAPASESVLQWFFGARWARAGARTLVLVTARETPSPTMRALFARTARFSSTHLRDLDERECLEFFSVRGVAVRDLAAVRGVCGGIPLVLELAACRARDTDGVVDVEDVAHGVDEVASALLEGWVPPGREKLLEILALLRSVDVALLEGVLGRDEAESARRWLDGLPFVAREPAGYRLHQLLRESVHRDLVRYAPDRHRELVARLLRGLIARMSDATVDQQCALLFEALHVGRGSTPVGEALPVPWYEHLRACRAEGEHIDVAASVVERHEGPAAAAFFREAIDARVLVAHVLTGLDGRPTALLGSVTLGALDETGLLERDPLAQLVARAVPRARWVDMVLVRWLCAADEYHQFGPALTVAMVSNIVLMPQSHQSASAVACVVSDPDRWEALAGPMGLVRAVDAEADFAGRRYGVYLGVIERDELGQSDAAAVVWARIPSLLGLTISRGAEAPAEPMDPDQLVAAVRDALQSLGRNDALARSPLASLVEGAGNEADVADRVRALLRNGVARLAESADYGPAVELLRVTYFDPGMKHEAAALFLRMPYGTYRYRHRRAVMLLAQSLVPER